MFRSRTYTRGPADRDRDRDRDRDAYRPLGSKFRGSGGAGRLPPGRVGKKTPGPKKTPVLRALSPRKKLESLKSQLAAKGIQYDANYVARLRQAQKGENSPTAAEDVASYKQKMSVTPDPERKCTETEIEKIQDALLDALEPLEDGCFPQFHGSYTVKGVLVMSCANEQTKLWLERTVPKLKPWKDGKLCVKPKGEVSQGTKVQLKTPKLFAKTDPKKILQMLSTQNKTLETNMWKNISVKTEDSGQTLVYLVDNQSLEAIRALNNKVFLGLSNVELVILNNEEDDKQNCADTEMKSGEEDDKTSADTEMKSGEEDDKTSADTEMKNQEEDDKQASVDTEMKNQEEDKKQTSVDAEMKNQDGDDKQTSVDTEMKNQEDDDKRTCVDTEMKNQEEDDKQTSVNTDVAPKDST